MSEREPRGWMVRYSVLCDEFFGGLQRGARDRRDALGELAGFGARRIAEPDDEARNDKTAAVSERPPCRIPVRRDHCGGVGARFSPVS